LSNLDLCIVLRGIKPGSHTAAEVWMAAQGLRESSGELTETCAKWAGNTEAYISRSNVDWILRTMTR